MNAKRFATTAIGCVVSVCLLACATVQVMAQSKGTIIGKNSCETWTQARQARRALVLEAWVFNYLKEANAAGDGTTDYLDGISAIGAWMDNYCKAHPLDDLSEGASVLMRELLARAKAK